MSPKPTEHTKNVKKTGTNGSLEEFEISIFPAVFEISTRLRGDHVESSLSEVRASQAKGAAGTEGPRGLAWILLVNVLDHIGSFFTTFRRRKEFQRLEQQYGQCTLFPPKIPDALSEWKAARFFGPISLFSARGHSQDWLKGRDGLRALRVSPLY